MGTQYRHVDVLIEEVSGLPPVRERLPHAILAHGEVTGHCHRIRESDAADLYSTNHGFHLHVRGRSVTVIHEEHNPISLPGSYYRVPPKTTTCHQAAAWIAGFDDPLLYRPRIET